MAVNLQGSVVIVTGASRGIGYATAETLAGRGATVVCVGRDEARLRTLAETITGSFVVADLRDPMSAEHIVGHAMTEHRRLDAVVANAGVGYVGGFAEMPPARIVELVDVNFRAPLLLARAAVEAIRRSERGGKAGAIVFVSSIAGAVGVPGESVYSATKAAIESFAALLREEVRPDGIAVSTVLPGVVDTQLLDTRAVPYDRRFPRPMPAQQVAEVIVDVLTSGAERRIEPRWLAIPARLAATAPRIYRSLARRFS